MDAVDRIFTLLDASGLEQQEFARRIGCTKAKVSQWKTTGLKSYTKYLPQIAAVLGTTVGYLLTGERDSAAGVQLGHLSPEALAIAAAFDAAGDKERDIIRRMLDLS